MNGHGCFPMRSRRSAGGPGRGRVDWVGGGWANALVALAAVLAAAAGASRVADGADPRVYLIIAADKQNFGVAVRDKMQADEDAIRRVFTDQAGGWFVPAIIPNDKPITSEAIDTTIDQVGKEIRPTDAVVFYFSGHGLYNEKDGFQIVVNERFGRRRSELRNRLLGLKARLTVLITDVCAGNQTLPIIQPPGRFPPPKLSPLFSSLLFKTSGLVDITSSTPPELSWVSGEHENSVFTWALVRTLRAKEANGNATWQDIFSATKSLTVEQSIREQERFGGVRKQVPLLVRYEVSYRGEKLPSVINNDLADGRGSPKFGLSMRLQENGTALVTAVAPDSPTQRAGVEPGDVIERWGGVGPFQSLEHLDRVVDQGGADVALTILNKRDGQRYERRIQAHSDQ